MPGEVQTALVCYRLHLLVRAQIPVFAAGVQALEGAGGAQQHLATAVPAVLPVPGKSSFCAPVLLAQLSCMQEDFDNRHEAHDYRFWHRRFLALRQYDRVAIKVSFTNALTQASSLGLRARDASADCIPCAL